MECGDGLVCLDHVSVDGRRDHGDEAYLARLKALRQQRDAIVEQTAAGLPAERALEWLRALGESLQATEKSKEKADVLHAIYERITVAGPEIVGVRLTQAAYAHGLARGAEHRRTREGRLELPLPGSTA